MTLVRVLAASCALKYAKMRPKRGTIGVKLRQFGTSKHFTSAMKRRILNHVIVIVSVVIAAGSAAAQQQSLGDVARKARKNKPAEPTTNVITNETLGSQIPSRAAADDDSKADAKKDDGDKDKDKKDEKKLSAEDQAKLDKEWQGKVDAAKNDIALAERELDVMQRENKLRAATYYADAGNRLRDEKKYAEEDRKYQADIAAKQKAIDDAKTKLEQTKDEARKAGANVS